MPSADRMSRERVEGQQTVARTARQVVVAAVAAGDPPICDLPTRRMQVHEKNAWTLRSLLG